MERARIEEVERYLAGLLVSEDSALERAVESASAAGLPSHQVSPLEGKLLYLLARIHGARRVLEVGTLDGPFDLVFLDADKPNNPAYLEWALKLTAKRSLIVADNVVREGAVADASTGDPSARGIRRFLEIVAAEPRLEATAIQTIGGKGHDGFALALVVS